MTSQFLAKLLIFIEFRTVLWLLTKVSGPFYVERKIIVSFCWKISQSHSNIFPSYTVWDQKSPSLNYLIQSWSGEIALNRPLSKLNKLLPQIGVSFFARITRSVCVKYYQSIVAQSAKFAFVTVSWLDLAWGTHHIIELAQGGNAARNCVQTSPLAICLRSRTGRAREKKTHCYELESECNNEFIDIWLLLPPLLY